MCLFYIKGNRHYVKLLQNQHKRPVSRTSNSGKGANVSCQLLLTGEFSAVYVVLIAIF